MGDSWSIAATLIVFLLLSRGCLPSCFPVPTCLPFFCFKKKWRWRIVPGKVWEESTSPCCLPHLVFFFLKWKRRWRAGKISQPSEQQENTFSYGSEGRNIAVLEVQLQGAKRWVGTAVLLLTPSLVPAGICPIALPQVRHCHVLQITCIGNSSWKKLTLH